MPRPFSWHQLHASPATDDASVDPRRRLRLCLWAFLILVGVIFGRVIQLEVSQGAAFRHEATKPLVRQESLLGVRGRILARNGTVLAYDKQTLALAVHYRYLGRTAQSPVASQHGPSAALPPGTQRPTASNSRNGSRSC